MSNGHRSHFTWAEKIGIALALIVLSALLYGLDFFFFQDLNGIVKYVAHHVAFLPIHALILGVIIEEMLSFREHQARKKRLNMFLGTYFRQMGVDILMALINLVNNRDELDKIITVHPDWDKRDFHAARQALAGFKLDLSTDALKQAAVFNLLLSHERGIIEMTRTPSLWEFESFYRSLMAIFHLIEETRFRGPAERLGESTRRHLADDMGKTLVLILMLWMAYLEFLKGAHPVLFKFQMGVHNTVQPIEMDQTWEE